MSIFSFENGFKHVQHLRALKRFSAISATLVAVNILVACGGGSGAPTIVDTASLDEVPPVPVVVKAVDPNQIIVTGAIFTTKRVAGICTGTDENIYTSKLDVYLDGGPRNGSAAGLPDGDYWVQVTEPNGALLGITPDASQKVKVVGGIFQTCYQLWDILVKASDGLKGYDQTTNPGCEFKVWVSQGENGGATRSFLPNRSKTDNFKVCKPDDPPPPPVGFLNVQKFYDANANGVMDFGEVFLSGWKANVSTTPITIGDVFTYYSSSVTPGPYVVSEYMPLPVVGVSWLQTLVRVDESNNPTPLVNTIGVGTASFNVLDTKTYTVSFGNVCLAGGNGHTLGFWSNKNGQALLVASDFTLLTGLNLVDGSGDPFNPSTKDQLKTWLLNGTAVNMAYMLSVQLTAMELNVAHGFVAGTAIVYAPGVPDANSLGFITINALMAAANTKLGEPGGNLTLSGSPLRGVEEAIKNALDNANNSLNFVSPTPCAFGF